MTGFFRGRLAVFLSIACAVAMTLNGAQSAAAGLVAVAQPDRTATAVAQPVDMYPSPSRPSAATRHYPRAAAAQPVRHHGDAVRPHDARPASPSSTSDGPPIDRSPPVVDSSQPPPSPYRCTPGRDVQETIARCESTDTGEKVSHKHGHGNIFWTIAVAAVVAITIGAILHKTTFSSDGNEQALLEQGPQLPVSYPDGSLSVRGFTRDGWPIVIDLQPQPGTITQLEVTTGSGHHRHTEKMVLDADGSHGRQLVKVAMPSTGSARNPTPATYVVSSIPIATFDSDRPQAVGLAPLKIYGIGGGPRAVGSVAIEQLAFNQTTPGARFSYFAKSEFNRARAQVQQLQRATDGTIQIQPVVDFFGSNLSIGQHGGTWSGPDPEAPPAPRIFRLQVTAWFTSDDRSWVAALAPDLITQ
jgi:hypothetical protein